MQPTSTTDATHNTSATDAQVNTTAAVCETFSGDGGTSLRFVLIQDGKKLRVAGDGTGAADLVGTNGNFPIKLTGSSGANKTTVEVTAGDAKGINFIGPSSGAADDVVIDITGDVLDCKFQLRDDVNVDVSGDMTNTTGSQHLFVARKGGTVDVVGDVAGMDVRVGVAGNVTSVGVAITVGSIGETTDGPDPGTDPDGIEEDWFLKGKTTLVVNNDFHGDDPVNNLFKSLIQLEDEATMDVTGSTFGSDWHILDDSDFTADTVATKITGGEWEVEDDGQVVATEVLNGEWLVETNGGDEESFGLDVTGKLNPELLVVDGLDVASGGAVRCQNLSDGDTEWDMEIKGGGTVEVTLDAWHAGDHPQAPNSPDGFSKLTYTGTRNEYKVLHELIIMGELIEGNDPSNALKITVGTSAGNVFHFLNPATQLVYIDAGVTKTNTFDAQEVTVEMFESFDFPQIAALEAIGPDYRGEWHQTGGEDDLVLFTDSPCVKPWKKIVFKAATGPSADEVELLDAYVSTPISGSIEGDFVDALYVTDLTVESGATVDVDGLDPRGINIYYTGTSTVNGSIICTGGANIDCTSGAYTPIQLTATIYGDFDGDSATPIGGDSDDIAFFNAHFPCSSMDAADCDPGETYNVVVDFDCDGDTDCADRAQFIANFPGSSGLDDNSCP